MQEVFEKIIGKLEEEEVQAYDKMDGGATYKSFRKAIEIVDQEAEQYNNGWVPCSERLPDRNKPVLCWVRSTTIASGETHIIGSCDNGFWFLQTYEIGNHHFPVKDYEVIAWQPLPEPYQPKGE